MASKDSLRTPAQHRALHKWFGDVADKLNNAGISPQVFVNLGIEIRWTKEMVKEDIWKAIQLKKFKTDSTKELTIGDLQEIYEDIDLELLQNPLINVDIPFPNIQDKNNNEMYGK